MSDRDHSGDLESAGSAEAPPGQWEGSTSTQVVHAGSKKWSPVQIGFVPPLRLVSPDYSIFGLRFGLVLEPNADVIGLDFGLIHFVEDRMYGLQFGLLNFASILRGIQFGLLNLVEEVYGFQVGLINKTEVLHGVQFGLLNFSEDRDGQVRVRPMISISFTADPDTEGA